jgi:hypothetical protein
MTKYFFSVVIISLGFFNYSYGSSPVLGMPIISGTGCTSNNTSVALSQDGQALSVLFDDFRAEAGNGTSQEVKTCTLVIPIDIPKGISLTIVKADYRGFNSLPKRTRAEFTTQYQFDGNNGNETRRSSKFKGPENDEFYDSNSIHTKSLCGGKRALKLNMNLSVWTNSQQDRAFSEIDTVDATQPGTGKKKDRKMKYQIKLEKCR